MPLTFMRYFYVGANLRWLMETLTWPNTFLYEQFMKTFRNAFKTVALGTARPEDFIPPEDNDLEPDRYDERREESLTKEECFGLRRLLQRTTTASSISRRAIFVPSADREGVTFATRKSGFRNSYVVFQDPTDPISGTRAGQISKMFLHKILNGTTPFVGQYFVVDEFVPLTDDHARMDPYRLFPDLQTHLVYSEMHTTQRIIRLQDIKSHFAAFKYTPEGIGKECFVVRSLDRVSVLVTVAQRVYENADVGKVLDVDRNYV